MTLLQTRSCPQIVMKVEQACFHGVRLRRKESPWQLGDCNIVNHEDRPKVEEKFHDKQSAIVPIEWIEKVPFDENILTHCMRTAKIPVRYRDKKLQL